MKRTSIFLPETLTARVASEAEATGLTQAEVIRRTLDAHLLPENATPQQKRRAKFLAANPETYTMLDRMIDGIMFGLTAPSPVAAAYSDILDERERYLEAHPEAAGLPPFEIDAKILNEREDAEAANKAEANS